MSGAAKDERPRIELLSTAQLLHEVLTESLCESVFKATRVTERVREGTLFAPVQFWNGVILRAPEALTQALQEAQRGETSRWPAVPATPEQAFFKRSKSLSWKFFANLFDAFLTRIVPKAKTTFCAELAALRQRFAERWVLDGLRLDPVANRLKLLWDVRSVVLPGCLQVAYDVFRGIPRIVQFDPDAAKGGSKRVFEILDRIPKGTLLLGDRLYASVALFASLTEKKLWGLFRRNKTLNLRKVKRLRSGKIRREQSRFEEYAITLEHLR